MSVHHLSRKIMVSQNRTEEENGMKRNSVSVGRTKVPESHTYRYNRLRYIYSYIMYYMDSQFLSSFSMLDANKYIHCGVLKNVNEPLSFPHITILSLSLSFSTSSRIYEYLSRNQVKSLY